MKVVFLDVDGVLNAGCRVVPGTKGFELQDWVIPKAIEHLNRITDRTGAKLVISSTWRIGKTVKELREMFAGVGVKAEILGKTEKGPCSWHRDAGFPECYQAHRGYEIQDWLRNYKQICDLGLSAYGRDPVESFVILDDDSDMDPHRDKHVHTDLYRGLTRRKVEEAIRVLG